MVITSGANRNNISRLRRYKLSAAAGVIFLFILEFRLMIKKILYPIIGIVLLAGCSNDSAVKIENVLLKDTLIPYQLTNQDPNKPKRISELMSLIDLSDVPPDFSAAFKEHIAAWGKSGEATQTGNKKLKEQAKQDIKSSFEKVQSIAQNYHAKLPPSNLLPPAFARDDSSKKEEWHYLGDSTIGCKWSYQTPLKATGNGFRFWTNVKCETSRKPSNDKYNFEYTSYSSKHYISCSKEKSWEEYSEYYDKTGNVVHTSESEIYGIKVQGPDMESQGLLGSVIGQNSLLRKVYKLGCG